MNHSLRNFLSQFEEFTSADVEALIQDLPVETYEKGDYIVKENALNDYCYFILEGCARQFELLDGEEKTTAFYAEMEAIMISNTTQDNRSKAYVEAAEPTLVIKGRSDNNVNMFEKYPKLQLVVMKLMEVSLNRVQLDFNMFIGSTPEEKFTKFMDTRPEFFNRFPQHQIASFLGMKPETLSRIKKRVYSK